MFDLMVAGHGSCGEGEVGIGGEKNQPIRVPYCRWGFLIFILKFEVECLHNIELEKKMLVKIFKPRLIIVLFLVK